MAKRDNVVKNTSTVINQTGEVLLQKNETIVPVGNEPLYFKVYIDLVNDLSNLINLSNSDKAVFLSLAKNMSFNNTVVLLKPIKQMIMKETCITSMNTINKAIDNLYKKKFIFREARSVYTVNPALVGKGKWEDNKALRLTIEYSDKGRKIEVAKISPTQLKLTENYYQRTIFDQMDDDAKLIEKTGLEEDVNVIEDNFNNEDTNEPHQQLDMIEKIDKQKNHG